MATRKPINRVQCLQCRLWIVAKQMEFHKRFCSGVRAVVVSPQEK